MRLGEAREAIEHVTRLVEQVPGVTAIVPAGSYRRGRESVADIDLLVETDDPAAVIESRSPARASAAGRATRGRSAGRPDDHAARRGRHVPGPLHRLGRAQRSPARDGARPGLVALGARLHAARRRRPASDLRHGSGGVRVPGSALHPARLARGPRRDRGRPRRHAAGRWSRATICWATRTATPTGRTGTTRSNA